MKKVSKFIGLILILLVVLASAVYIDYFIAKKKNIMPKIAIKEKINDEEVVYKAFFYKVWYCNENKEYIYGDYGDVDAVCPKKYNYENGYYTNELGVKISKKDIQLMTFKDIYTKDMIETMADEKTVKNASDVAYEYGKLIYQNVLDEDGNNKKEDNYDIIKFPEFEKNKDGNYEWNYDNDEEYCLKIENNIKYYSLYENKGCKNFKKIELSDDWCKLYKNSTLAFDEEVDKFCKE